MSRRQERDSAAENFEIVSISHTNTQTDNYFNAVIRV